MDQNPTPHVTASPTPDSQPSSDLTAGGSEGGVTEFHTANEHPRLDYDLSSAAAPAGNPVRRRKRMIDDHCVGDSHTPPCTECGKSFGSWKALFGHMRCHPDRAWRGINPPENPRTPARKGSSSSVKLAKPKEEEQEVAECLMMLKGRSRPELHHKNSHVSAEEAPEGSSSRFECSSCRKVFNSRQALGGHRASHRNVKGCFAKASAVLGEGKGRGAKPSHTWDLNLPAPIEDVQHPFNSPEICLDLSLGFSSRM